MAFRILARGEIGNTRCSLTDSLYHAIKAWLTTRDHTAPAPAPAPAISPTSIRSRYNYLKPRPIIALSPIPLTPRMRTLDTAHVFLMATFKNQPIAALPPLYRHFIRHTNSPGTPPAGPFGAIRICPQMRRANQYVLAVQMTLPPGTEMLFHNVWDEDGGRARYMVEPESLLDLEESCAWLLGKVPEELVCANMRNGRIKLVRGDCKD